MHKMQRHVPQLTNFKRLNHFEDTSNRDREPRKKTVGIVESDPIEGRSGWYCLMSNR